MYSIRLSIVLMRLGLKKSSVWRATRPFGPNLLASAAVARARLDGATGANGADAMARETAAASIPLDASLRFVEIDLRDATEADFFPDDVDAVARLLVVVAVDAWE